MIGPNPFQGANPTLELDWFPVRITEALSPSGYTFVACWIASDGAREDVPGGHYNAATDPAYPIDGSTFAEDDIALARRAPGMGGVGWELIRPGGANPTVWGADWRTATYPGPSGISPDQPYSGPEFDETSDPNEWVVLESTIIEIPNNIDEVVIRGNLRIGAGILVGMPFTDIFPDGYSSFSIRAGVVMLDDNCEVVWPLNYFGYSASGTPLNTVVSGQRLTTGGTGAVGANFGNITQPAADCVWYGDMPMFGRVDCALLRGPFSLTTVRLAWALREVSVSGFPATWTISVSQSTRPLTWLEWERRDPPTNTVIGCGSGSGSGSEPGCCEEELAHHPDLTFNVPDGDAAGDYTASWDGERWRTSFVVDDAIESAIIACVDGTWTLNGVPAESQDCDPFLATFPAAFGSTGDITVEVAP